MLVLPDAETDFRIDLETRQMRMRGTTGWKHGRDKHGGGTVADTRAGGTGEGRGRRGRVEIIRNRNGNVGVEGAEKMVAKVAAGWALTNGEMASTLTLRGSESKGQHLPHAITITDASRC